jgi:hypothetical protein
MQIAEIFETIMLICFGCSWPLNLVKNYKARTAKAMSLGFLLLIWFGYVVGIAAKLIKLCDPNLPNPTWYLLTVYILNLVIVSANVLVYFRNRHLDKLSAGKS